MPLCVTRSFLWPSVSSISSPNSLESCCFSWTWKCTTGQYVKLSYCSNQYGLRHAANEFHIGLSATFCAVCRCSTREVSVRAKRQEQRHAGKQFKMTSGLMCMSGPKLNLGRLSTKTQVSTQSLRILVYMKSPKFAMTDFGGYPAGFAPDLTKTLVLNDEMQHGCL